MTCACQTAHGFPCQFPGETDFFDFDGKKWCRFHLPLQDAAGNKSDKGRGEKGWEEGEKEWLAFKVQIFKLVSNKAALQHDLSGASQDRIDLYFRDFDIKKKELNFRGIAFPEISEFGGYLNHARGLYINFEQASFGGKINFSKTSFHSKFNFTKAIFCGVTNFDDSLFLGPADFTNVVFLGTVIFERARFSAKVNFEGTTFSAEASFYCATFSPRTSFEKAKFYGKANFTGAEIGDETSFKEAEFSGDAEFAFDGTEKGHFKRVDFSGAIFKGPCHFTNRKFTAEANFNSAVFHDLVEFHGCEFHQGMSFHQTKFLKTRGEDDDKTEELERSYRTLKLEMERLRARNEEADFFALEMECRRKRSRMFGVGWLAATLYKHLSDYGRSIARPLGWFTIVTTLFLAKYYFLFEGKTLQDAVQDIMNGGGELRTILGFTLQQVFRPFYVWGDVPKGTENGLVAACPLLIPLLASLQSLITIGLLTLFLLALRRHFKMD